mmetsp:Transcript_115678/g.327082  ORF Transcript_115678/g.327082 Transcript_115678/m.327082 type:complete len:508 (+) Transcript_115678:112-1635(+)
MVLLTQGLLLKAEASATWRPNSCLWPGCFHGRPPCITARAKGPSPFSWPSPFVAATLRRLASWLWPLTCFLALVDSAPGFPLAGTQVRGVSLDDGRRAGDALARVMGDLPTSESEAGDDSFEVGGRGVVDAPADRRMANEALPTGAGYPRARARRMDSGGPRVGDLHRRDHLASQRGASDALVGGPLAGSPWHSVTWAKDETFGLDGFNAGDQLASDHASIDDERKEDEHVTYDSPLDWHEEVDTLRLGRAARDLRAASESGVVKDAYARVNMRDRQGRRPGSSGDGRLPSTSLSVIPRVWPAARGGAEHMALAMGVGKASPRTIGPRSLMRRATSSTPAVVSPARVAQARMNDTAGNYTGAGVAALVAMVRMRATTEAPPDVVPKLPKLKRRPLFCKAGNWALAEKFKLEEPGKFRCQAKKIEHNETCAVRCPLKEWFHPLYSESRCGIVEGKVAFDRPIVCLPSNKSILVFLSGLMACALMGGIGCGACCLGIGRCCSLCRSEAK